jgi:small-conductance mechanosensitive channel
VLLAVVNNVRAAGILTVQSAGNSGPTCSTIRSPAGIYDASFTIGATDNNDLIASFSSRGPVSVDGSNRLKPDVSAPGVSIFSTQPGGGYRYLSGTIIRPPQRHHFQHLAWRMHSYYLAKPLAKVYEAITMRAAGLVRRTGDIQFLRLAFTLVAAAAVIRLFVYILRRSFPRSSWIGTFERAIALVIWLLVALHVTGVLADLIEMFEAVHIPIGRQRLTLWDLLVGAVSVVLTLLAALWIGSVIEARLMATTSLTPNSRVVASRLLKALLALVAVLVALSLVGIDLTVLSVFGGALGVGLGLGLQRIASNYVSGFIILLDHSLTIGDMITVDKYYGAVSQINTRYTVIKALDGTETIVPNEMLVSSPVINHSYTDRKVRVVVKVSVAYESDVDRALQVLVEAARGQPRVLAEPAPAAFITGFGADGIDLEVGFWIHDPEEGTLGVRSAIARVLLQRFKEERIEIPFPQRDIRISGISPELGMGKDGQIQRAG